MLLSTQRREQSQVIIAAVISCDSRNSMQYIISYAFRDSNPASTRCTWEGDIVTDWFTDRLLLLGWRCGCVCGGGGGEVLNYLATLTLCQFSAGPPSQRVSQQCWADQVCIGMYTYVANAESHSWPNWSPSHLTRSFSQPIVREQIRGNFSPTSSILAGA